MCGWRLDFSSLALVLVITLQADHVSSSERSLSPGLSIDREVLRFGTEAKRYNLENLKPNTGYEVRVSYPATVPSKVTLQLISTNSAQPVNKHRRQLLDTEKITFYTDEKGQKHVVEMHAEAVGIHRDGPAAKPEYFLYNIVLMELILGIPTDALPVVLMVLFAVVAVMLLLPWWVDCAVPAMLSFMAASRTAKHSVHTS